MGRQGPRLFRARAAWTGQRLIERPILVEREGRIAAVESEPRPSIPPGAEEIDFGDAIVLPGFVNAHCHLEYSCLKERLAPRTEFAGWLAELVRQRFMLGEEAFTRGVEEGLAGAIAAGTTAMFDVFTRGRAEAPLRASGMRAWAFLEAIELDPAKAEAASADLLNRLERLNPGARFQAGLSPHAPYSVSMPLARKIGQLAEERGLPLAIHLAESQAERRMLAAGDGPLADLFRKMAVLPEGWTAPGLSPTAWTQRAGLLGRRTLVIHANYLDDEEIALLAASGASIAFCPKSHAFFGHGPHPLERLLAAGANVCIGTDSLASNDRLDVLAELAEARRAFPRISARRLFEMAGANAARFLGLTDRLGALDAGYECDLTALAPAPPMDRGEDEALEGLLNPGAARAVAAVVGGEVVWRRG